MYQIALISWTAANTMERRVDFNDKLEMRVMIMLVTNTTVKMSLVEENKWVK